MTYKSQLPVILDHARRTPARQHLLNGQYNEGKLLRNLARCYLAAEDELNAPPLPRDVTMLDALQYVAEEQHWNSRIRPTNPALGKFPGVAPPMPNTVPRPQRNIIQIDVSNPWSSPIFQHPSLQHHGPLARELRLTLDRSRFLSVEETYSRHGDQAHTEQLRLLSEQERKVASLRNQAKLLKLQQEEQQLKDEINALTAMGNQRNSGSHRARSEDQRADDEPRGQKRKYTQHNNDLASDNKAMVLYNSVTASSRTRPVTTTATPPPFLFYKQNLPGNEVLDSFVRPPLFAPLLGTSCPRYGALFIQKYAIDAILGPKVQGAVRDINKAENIRNFCTTTGPVLRLRIQKSTSGVFFWPETQEHVSDDMIQSFLRDGKPYPVSTAVADILEEAGQVIRLYFEKYENEPRLPSFYQFLLEYMKSKHLAQPDDEEEDHHQPPAKRATQGARSSWRQRGRH